MFAILVIISSFKFINYYINYNKKNNFLTLELAQAPHVRLVGPAHWQAAQAPKAGPPSARWLQLGARLAGVACSTPKPDSQALGVCNSSKRASSLALGFCRLQPHHMPPPNSAAHSVSTHSLQYLCYSAKQCNPR